MTHNPLKKRIRNEKEMGEDISILPRRTRLQKHTEDCWIRRAHAHIAWLEHMHAHYQAWLPHDIHTSMPFSTDTFLCKVMISPNITFIL